MPSGTVCEYGRQCEAMHFLCSGFLPEHRLPHPGCVPTMLRYKQFTVFPCKELPMHSGFSYFITARKLSLRRLCFYTCLSVILFTFCVILCLLPGGAWSQGVSASGGVPAPGGPTGPHPRGKLRGIWSRPTCKGAFEGDLVQAHTQEGS